MQTLAETTITTTASPAAIFALWADVNHWAEFDPGIEWAKLATAFTAGGRYTIKPKGGPKVRATILVVDPNKTFIDVSHLPGAHLRFEHRIRRQNGRSIVHIVMSVRGPLAWLWAKILGKNQQADLEKSTANLIAKAEGRALHGLGVGGA